MDGAYLQSARLEVRLNFAIKTARCSPLFCSPTPQLAHPPRPPVASMSSRTTKRSHDSSPAPSSAGEGPAASDRPVQKKARESSPELDDGAGERSSDDDDDDTYDGVEAVAARALLAQDGEVPMTTAARKRATFLKNWGGKTPEQILGASCMIFFHTDTDPSRSLDKLSKKWCSKAYAHFRPPVIHRATPGGPVMHRFVCKK